MANIRSSAGRTTTAGPRVGEGAGDDLADGVERRQCARDAETRCQRGEVGPGQLGGGGLAERVGHVLAQDAVAAVVDDQPGDVGVVLAGGGQFGDRVHGAAVTGDREGALAGADRRGQRGGEREAESAGALGGVELAVERIPRRPCPVAGDRHVPERVRAAAGRRRADRASASVRPPGPGRRACPAPTFAARPRSPAPSPASRGDDLLGDRRQRQCGVGVDAPAPGWLASSTRGSASTWISRPCGAKVK